MTILKDPTNRSAVSAWGRLSCGLMLLQGVLLAFSAFWNSVTFDEVNHLPAGISYWHKGEFWCYHHNPPFVKQLFALPAVLMDVPTDYSRFRYVPGSRGPDFDVGNDFLKANRDNYELLFSICRLVVVGLTVWGGRVVFRWASEIYDERAGFLSQALWTFSPIILAHGSVVTPDMGSTVFGFYATYCFWRYLNEPTAWRAVLCGLWLGLTEASKYSFVILPAIWLAILIVRMMTKKADDIGLRSRTRAEFTTDGFLVFAASLLVLNNLYLYEGTGAPLGELKFVSRSLTTGADEPGRNQKMRMNRFQGTLAGWIPMPFPEQYLLGFDDQLRDVDSGQFQNYLCGELRRGHGWWYYYLYCLLVKTPLGTLVIAALAVVAFVRRFRNPDCWFNDATLLFPIVAFLAMVSVGNGINSHMRYVLPIYPFGAVFLGGAINCFQQVRWRNCVLGGLLLSNVISVGRFTPFYLPYFNEAVGGPRQGWRHLADSNLDWGQGLIALRAWLRQHATGRPIQFAYLGGMHPEVLGLNYEVPGVLPPDESVWDHQDGPRPGLHVISANYLAGLNYPPTNGKGGRKEIPEQAYVFYQQLKPAAVIANCLYVYELDANDVNRLRRDAGLAEWKDSSIVPE